MVNWMGMNICLDFPNERSAVQMKHTLQPRYTKYELSCKSMRGMIGIASTETSYLWNKYNSGGNDG